MNRAYLSAFVKLIVLALVLCAAALSSVSADATTDAVGCKLALITNSKIIQGQPILLRYTLTNLSSHQAIAVHVGINKTEWYTLSLMDEAGQSASVIPDNRPQKPRGAHRGTFERLSPQASSSGCIVVSRFFGVQHPGNFVLKMHIAASYAPEDAETENTAQIASDINSGGMIYKKDFTFPLTVTPTNVLALQETASALKQDFLKEPIGDLHDADLDALFAMPETVAASMWEDLAGGATIWNAKAIARKLAELRSVQATNILARMLDNPAIGQNEKAYIKRCVDETYNNGSMSLRNHIKSMAASRGIVMPEKVVVPTPVD